MHARSVEVLDGVGRAWGKKHGPRGRAEPRMDGMDARERIDPRN